MKRKRQLTIFVQKLEDALLTLLETLKEKKKDIWKHNHKKFTNTVELKQEKGLTCNSEAMKCCKNWAFAVEGFHLSNWKNQNRFHQLHLYSNPSPHLLHHSQWWNCFLKQSYSSSFKNLLSLQQFTFTKWLTHKKQKGRKSI